MAGFPNRCHHIKVNGTQCGSPALRRNRFCYFHKLYQDQRIKLSADRASRGVPTFILPVLEDANSIQIALMQVMQLLVSQQIDHKTASLLLYALQTASNNLRLTNFKPDSRDVILNVRDVADTALDEHVWEEEDFEEVEDEDEAQAEAEAAAREEADRNERDRKRRERIKAELADVERLTNARHELNRLKNEGRFDPYAPPPPKRPAPVTAPAHPTAAPKGA
jgi:hypothetical protein